jgi:quercetin dioxygenase-like cupin family protein
MSTKSSFSDDETWPDTLTGALGDALTPAPLDSVDCAMLKSRLLARVREDATGKATTTITRSDDGWQPFSSRVQIKILRREEHSTSYLLKLEPGAVIYPHHHRQDEECMVMEGEVIIGDVRASAGAYHFAPVGVDHLPIRSDTGATLFLRGSMPGVRDLAKRETLKMFLSRP